MQWFRNASIRVKLSGGFGLTMFLFLIMTLLALMVIQIPTLACQALTQLDNQYTDLQNILIAVKDYQLHNDPKAIEKIEAANQDFNKNHQQMMKILKIGSSH